MSDSTEIKPKPKRKYKKRATSPHNPIYKDRKHVLRVLELAAIDTPQQLIANSTNMTVKEVQNIVNEYKGMFSLLEDLPKLRRIKGEILEATLLNVVKAMSDPQLVCNSDLVALSKALRELNVVHRLHEGKSTSNANVQSVSFSGKSLADIVQEPDGEPE